MDSFTESLGLLQGAQEPSQQESGCYQKNCVQSTLETAGAWRLQTGKRAEYFSERLCFVHSIEFVWFLHTPEPAALVDQQHPKEFRAKTQGIIYFYIVIPTLHFSNVTTLVW